MTLFCYRPSCFSHVNHVVLMPTSLHLHMKSRRVCIKRRSPPASLPLKGKVTRHTTVKWPIGSHQSLEWKFPWDVRVPFPRPFQQGRISTGTNKPKGLELVAKSTWNARFPFENSVGKFWTTFQDIPFSPETFRLGRPN